MAMCGADAADWEGTVGEGGIYEGGEGKFYAWYEQAEMIRRVDKAASKVAASRSGD